MPDTPNVSLANLAQGAAIERFDDELRNVLNNILDPNTTLAKREIVLKVIVEPNENRMSAQVQVICTSKPAPAHSLGSVIFIGRDRDGAVATEPIQQATLPLDNVTPLHAVNGR